MVNIYIYAKMADFSTFVDISKLGKPAPSAPSVSLADSTCPMSAYQEPAHQEPVYPETAYSETAYPSAYNARAESPGYLRQSLSEKLQLPILISILYFLLQLPLVEQCLKIIGISIRDRIPGADGQMIDGPITTEGHILKSGLMGGLFYAIHMALITL